MLLQPLRTRDPDELAGGFRRWDLRFRQFGGGSFRGERQQDQPWRRYGVDRSIDPIPGAGQWTGAHLRVLCLLGPR
jgi:hypothetical protein